MASTEIHYVRKTSQSHPLRADIVVRGQGTGWLGITFIPGKKGPGRTTTVWDREVETDVAHLQSLGTTGLVSLVTTSELAAAHATDLPDKARQAGMDYIEFPLPEDKDVPDAESVHKIVSDLAMRVEIGERVVVFSNHGWGRTGVIAACVMLRLKRNTSAEDAIQHIRNVRSVWCIVRDTHVRFVHQYAERLRKEFASPVAAEDVSPRVSPMPEGKKGRSFLLGFDGSKFSQEAFRTVVSLMKADDTLFVATIHEKARADRVPTMERPAMSMDYHMKYCDDHHITVFPIDVESTGSAGEELCRLARINEVSMIVVGTRGQANMSKMLLGSTSRYLSDHAPCSVLIVREGDTS